MEALKQMLMQVDDEYLTGLCNKGTVKRAYKDLEQEEPAAVWLEGEAEVTLKEAVCRIRMPLGESTCTCPSRSVCRHLITAVLYLRKNQEEPEPTGEAVTERKNEQAAEGERSGKEAVKEAVTAEAFPWALEQELLAFPLRKLKRACGNKRYGQLLDYLRAGERPQLQEGTVITVKVPWEDVVVKLLSPLEYSACTCKSRELCPHKAQAILLFQLHRKAVALERLERLSESSEEWNYQELERAASSVKEGIRIHLTTGLSRLSPEAAESMERLAVISHGAGLAVFETGLRKIASEYRLYFERAAAFRTEGLLEQLLTMYEMADRLEKTREPEKLRALAGSFRDVYHSLPRLHLTGLGSRSFHSKTGYEGEIYYFLEPEKGGFYTWTDARPVFYEGVGRRIPGSGERAPAPWGLNCSREQMIELEFFLSHAKGARGGKLSVSQETKSEIAGLRDFRKDEIRRAVFWNYEKLLESFSGKPEQETFGERLALVGAFRCKEGNFDTVRQRFSMELFDPKGRRIAVSVQYSREEKLTIKVLERMSERLKKEESQPLIFFGIPYLEEGKLCLYPIEVFGRERFFETQEELEQYLQKSGELKENSQDSPSCRPNYDIIRGMERFLREIREALGDLFQSGLNSVREETVENLGRLAGESGTLGLHRAEEDLAFLEKALGNKRRRMEFDPEPVLERWIRLTAYVRFCLEKVSLDRALGEMYHYEENET